MRKFITTFIATVALMSAAQANVIEGQFAGRASIGYGIADGVDLGSLSGSPFIGSFSFDSSTLQVGSIDPTGMAWWTSDPSVSPFGVELRFGESTVFEFQGSKLSSIELTSPTYGGQKNEFWFLTQSAGDQRTVSIDLAVGLPPASDFTNPATIGFSCNSLSDSDFRAFDVSFAKEGNVVAGLALYLTSISATSVQAIPEPETYAMLLAGLGLLGFMERRRKQKAA